ncbi:MAG: methionine synthase [Actinobacteria bacterium]|nr:methionine synthase [Actinomycetota bacterium]
MKKVIPNSPEILTTTVGSYPLPSWLTALPSEEALIDATRVIIDIQRQAGIDLPTDGELYRFDINHPDTNGMIDYFVGAMDGVRTKVGRSDWLEFSQKSTMSFREKPAGVVESALGEGGLNLFADCSRAVRIASAPLKFTVTSPYMLARTLLDKHYENFEALTLAIAEILAQQASDLPSACVQIDEANLPGNSADWPLASQAINMILDNINTERAVHLCFGNYSGQTIQKGTWHDLLDFINSLHVDHLILELAHRPQSDLDALADIDAKIKIGIGVVDIKINHIETADEIAQRIDEATKELGNGRVRWVHPDCGFWMLKRSVADRKIEALVKGRNRFLGI